MSAHCDSCGAPVVWAITPAGAKNPIDSNASPEGNVLLLRPSQLDGNVLAVTLSKGALELARTLGSVLRVSHWATCPDRQEWRQRTDQKREGVPA